MSREDCKEDKNGETICYCKNDLCNTPERKLSDPSFAAVAASTSAHHPRREGVARALHSGSKLNSATTDDEDFGKNRHHDDDEGSGEEEYYDTTYFDEYDDDDEHRYLGHRFWIILLGALRKVSHLSKSLVSLTSCDVMGLSTL